MSDTEISASDLAGTEYQPNETFIALMSNQGNVTHYNIVLPMQAVLHSVKKVESNLFTTAFHRNNNGGPGPIDCTVRISFSGIALPITTAFLCLARASGLSSECVFFGSVE